MKKIVTVILLSLGIASLSGQSKNNSKEIEFKFKDSKNTACFVCNHIFDKSKSVLYVTHDSDGYWQFLCGEDHHTEDDIKVISLLQAVQLDNTINDLYEMPLNVGAERKSITEKWEPFKMND
ncbi:hypothetical protein [Chryseobacterium sediminis]|uniref:hypothetical protein n=1 Tax=Chryseobacterium sediminis TaxID=1679494 RepID=UPI001F4FBC40|nr:hypothetical protein [Chryseobacterium sediminis]